MKDRLRLGIDIGSTTAKIVLTDADARILYSNYRRHNAEVFSTLLAMLSEIPIEHRQDSGISVLFTGTAGMGIAERAGIPFVQEVSASAEVVKTWMPEVRTFIDLGGEDAKIIFFDKLLRPDIRMNGNCAGGTGAFIDQMASLLDIPVEELSEAASRKTAVYNIASRCGVFAKTDVQNLISRDVSPQNIAASIYRAVAFQIISALARGVKIAPKLLFAGGPFYYQPELKRMFLEVIGFSEEDTVDPLEIDPKLTPDRIPAAGAALRAAMDGKSLTFGRLLEKLEASRGIKVLRSSSLEPLFADAAEKAQWEEQKSAYRLRTVALEDAAAASPAAVKGANFFLGIDSGSTTTKIVLIDADGRLAYTFYAANKGTPVETVWNGLSQLHREIVEKGLSITIARSAVTGYGEDLIKFAFTLDEGHVETIAHFRGASFFEPDVSFILDIGGQDMKAIFVKDRIITNIELNESCSSGSGSFIQTFANSMGLDVESFAEKACLAAEPHDLGSRCTVFMNSKVKQVLREGGEIGDISAGLAYSVIRNCLNKVLKITDFAALGPNIVVQGGAFRNPAVLRAMELVTGRSVIRPDRAELMGAWGAALMARDAYLQKPEPSMFPAWEDLRTALNYEKKTAVCQGCENSCEITILSYPGRLNSGRLNSDGRVQRFFTGNKCEKVFSNQPAGMRKGENLAAFKRDLLFNRPAKPELMTPGLRIGIPRVLNMWEDYPFWATLFTEVGCEVALSDVSTLGLAEKGYSSVMSENICFPAKITNGHIINLVEKKVDRIFYPKVRYTANEYSNVINKYNCPIVTGYPQVIESSINPEGTYGIPFDAPPVSFHDRGLLRKACTDYLLSIGIQRELIDPAVRKAVRIQREYRRLVREEAARIAANAVKEDRRVILLAGRPYHMDALINMKIPSIISDLGFDVITEDSVPRPARDLLPKVHVLTQWTLHNRLFHAAHYAGRHKHIELIQLNSFGCGPDALTTDEVKSIMNEYGKNPTLIKIDEMTSPGSVRLRIRSLIESLKLKPPQSPLERIPRLETRIFGKRDKQLTVLAPQFSPFYTDFIIAAYRHQGYKIEILPMGDRESIELGLRYSNNDICYPATIVIGDILKALRSGRYDLTQVAVGLTQTGGQCRASSYVSLLKRALLKAGYDTIPVVTASTTTRGKRSMNEQPGFRVRTLPFAMTALYGLIFGDVMAKLYYYASVREIKKGSAMLLVNKYIELGKTMIHHRARKNMFKLIHQAVDEFNRLPMDHSSRPKVGIVGEIYVKFNPFGNLHTADWLISRGIQPEVPPLIDFFLIPLMSTPYNARNNIEKVKYAVIHLLSRAEGFVNRLFIQANSAMDHFTGKLTPFHPISRMAAKASLVIDLINQFGETWLLAGDIATFAEEAVNTIVCLQPFGCIANHVIARGIERKMKDLYPDLNLLFLDMDSGMSEVNVANRMEFIVDGLKQRERALAARPSAKVPLISGL
jgi:predicted CoA-substrate-specific enzyme activase